MQCFFSAILLTALLCFPVRAANLFTPVANPPAQSDPTADLTLRSRAVQIDFDQLETAAALAATPPAQASKAGGASAPPLPGARMMQLQTKQTVHASPPPAPGAILTLNLFDDVVVRGRVEHTAPTFSGGYSLSGHLVDQPLGAFTLVVNGETVAGTVLTPDGEYRILGEGVYAVNEIDRSQLPECGVDELTHADHPSH